MGRNRRERARVQNQEEKTGNERNPEIRKKNQVYLTLPIKHIRAVSILASFFFSTKEEKSSQELFLKSLACCRNSVLCKVSVELDNSLEKVKLRRKSL